MKNILVPVDFSINSKKALQYAAAYAQDINARLVLVHVDEPVRHLTVSVMVAINGYNKAVEKKLDRWCSEIKQKYKINCSWIYRQGDVIRQVLSVSREKDTWMIAMGTKGASGIKEKLVGSLTSKLVSRAKCPVMVIPGGAVYQGLKNVVYATDYHQGDIKRLQALTKFVYRQKTFIQVVHVCPAQDRVPEQMLLENFASHTRKHVRYSKLVFKLLTGEVENALNNYIKNKTVDALVISADSKNWIEKMLGSRMTRKMVCHTRIPLLAWKNKVK